MMDIRIKLTSAQILVLETAGVFEEPLDEDDKWLSAAVQDGYLVTGDPQRLWRMLRNLSSNADDYACKRGPRLDADARRMYRYDRDVLSRLGGALNRRSLDQHQLSENQPREARSVEQCEGTVDQNIESGDDEVSSGPAM
jgi:hypothetical protein